MPLNATRSTSASFAPTTGPCVVRTVSELEPVAAAGATAAAQSKANAASTNKEWAFIVTAFSPSPGAQVRAKARPCQYSFTRELTKWEANRSAHRLAPGDRGLAGLGAQGHEPCRHETRQALLARGKVLGFTASTGEPVDAPGPSQGMHERAGDEIVAPEDVHLGALRQGFPEDADQLENDGIEVLVHHRGAFG